MKDNNNNSSSFSYSENVVNPNGSNLKNDGLITNDCINNNSNDVSDENTNHSDNDNDNNKEKVSDTNSSLKWNKRLPKGVKRSLSKIITNVVSMLAVKKRKEIQNLSQKLMILPVRMLKRHMQKRQYSY